MSFRTATLHGLLGGGFAGAVLRGLDPTFIPPVFGTQTSMVSVRLIDFVGTDSVSKAFVSLSTENTFAAADAALGEWLTALDRVTGARIAEVFQNVVIPLPDGLKGTAELGSIKQAALALAFTNDQDTRSYELLIPAVSYSVVSRGGPDMTSGATIDHFVTAMETGLTGTTGGHFTTDRDGSLVAGLKGMLVLRKRKRDLQRSRPKA
jgi:hypothetical protein